MVVDVLCCAGAKGMGAAQGDHRESSSRTSVTLSDDATAEGATVELQPVADATQPLSVRHSRLRAQEATHSILRLPVTSSLAALGLEPRLSILKCSVASAAARSEST